MALSLPEAHEEPHFEYDSFRVRGKIFATMPPDGQHLHVFVDDAMRDQALTIHADCVEKLFWGAKVAGLRVNLAKAKPAFVNSLLENAWKRKAPKRTVAQYERPLQSPK
jgi:hypothetical protein